MAILAEIGNPIRRQIIQTQVSSGQGIARGLGRRQHVEVPRQEGIIPEETMEAIVSEITNPVSRQIIKAQFLAVHRQLSGYNAAIKEADDNYNKDVWQISETIAGVATGAVRIASLIPTWISVTAGLSAILIEVIHNINVILGIVCIWVVFWGFIGIRFFAIVDYYNTAYLVLTPSFGSRMWERAPKLVREKTTEQLLTIAIILANIIVIAVCFAWYCSQPSYTSERHVEQPDANRTVLLVSGLTSPIPQSNKNSIFDISLNPQIQDLRRPLIIVFGSRQSGRRDNR
jgi:hypothetical protein